MNVSISDWIAAGSMLITAAAAVGAFLQIRIATKQLEHSRRTAREQMASTYLTSPEFRQLEEPVRSRCFKWGHTLRRNPVPLSDRCVKEILHNNELYYRIVDYLNFFQTFSSMVLSGAMDKELARQNEGYKVIATYAIFRPFIKHCQKLRPTIYKEFEDLAYEWDTQAESVDKVKEILPARPGIESATNENNARQLTEKLRPS